MSVCGSLGPLLGGYGLLGGGDLVSKLYRIISPHTSVRVQLQLAQIDLWDGDALAVFADGRRVWNRTFSSAAAAPSQCGDPRFGDVTWPVDCTVNHTSPFLTLTIATTRARNISLGAYWWGVAAVSLTVGPPGSFWSQANVSGQKPAPRAHHAAALFQDAMFVFGGTAAADPGVAADRAAFDGGAGGAKLGDCFAFNTSTAAWAPVNATGPAPAARSHHSFTAGLGDGLVLYGGQAQSGLFLSDVAILTARTLEWLRPAVLGRGPGPRAGHAAAALAGRLWVYGGYRMDPASRNIRLVPDGVACLDLASLVWRPASWLPPAPAPRYGHALVASLRPEPRLVLGGGATADPVHVTVLGDVAVMSVGCDSEQGARAGGDLRWEVMGCGEEATAEAAAAEKLRSDAAARLGQLGQRLADARMAVALRREQHELDKTFMDDAVEGYVTAVHGLIGAGAVYSSQLSDLAQARRNRLQTEEDYVTSMDALDGARRALEAEMDLVRRTAAAAAQQLDRRGAVVARARAEAALGAGAHHTCAVSEGSRAVCLCVEVPSGAPATL